MSPLRLAPYGAFVFIGVAATTGLPRSGFVNVVTML